jgi:hypothetical protein
MRFLDRGEVIIATIVVEDAVVDVVVAGDSISGLRA